MADNISILAGAGTNIATDEVGGAHYQRFKLSVGANNTATDGGTYKTGISSTRPANTTAYTVNDAVNDNATAGSVGELLWVIPAMRGIVRRVRVKKSNESVATPTLRLWFYDTLFNTAAGDNMTFIHPATDAIGYVDVDVTSTGTDDAVGWTNCDIPFTLGTFLFGQLQTLSAFTPASGEVFTVHIQYLAG